MCIYMYIYVFFLDILPFCHCFQSLKCHNSTFLPNSQRIFCTYLLICWASSYKIQSSVQQLSQNIKFCIYVIHFQTILIDIQFSRLHGCFSCSIVRNIFGMCLRIWMRYFLKFSPVSCSSVYEGKHSNF